MHPTRLKPGRADKLGRVQKRAERYPNRGRVLVRQQPGQPPNNFQICSIFSLTNTAGSVMLIYLLNGRGRIVRSRVQLGLAESS